MTRKPAIRKRAGERGQTLALVAMSLVVLIAVAALAIDTTTLYVARTEAQRAADAAALAGARAFVDSGTTTDPADTDLPLLAQALAGNSNNTGYMGAVLQQNKVGGVVPDLTATFDFTTHPGNPQVTVTVQRTDLPIFFARIFGRTVATVTAHATAEAYNSSNAGTGATNMPPVGPSCVKPFLVVNFDPAHANGPFIDPASGTIPNAGVWTGPGTGVIGEQITLPHIWVQCHGAKCGLPSLPLTLSAPTYVGFLPANLASISGTCPSCSVGLPSNMSEGVACCDTVNQYQCGSTTSNVHIEQGFLRQVSTLEGASCLMNGTAIDSHDTGQDTIDVTGFESNPATTPMRIQSPRFPGQFVTTSKQIITLPIIDTTLLNSATGQVKVIGFMQAFLQQTNDDADLVVTVLNISACGSNVDPAATPISGGGTSPIPVRLIHP